MKKIKVSPDLRVGIFAPAVKITESTESDIISGTVVNYEDLMYLCKSRGIELEVEYN